MNSKLWVCASVLVLANALPASAEPRLLAADDQTDRAQPQLADEPGTPPPRRVVRQQPPPVVEPPPPPPPAAYVYPPHVYAQDGFYIGGGFMHQGLQTRFTGGGFQVIAGAVAFGTPLGANPADFSQRLAQYGFTASAGYVFRDGVVPPWIGRNFRVELDGWYVDGATRENGGTVPAGTNVVLYNLAGVIPPGSIGVLGGDMTSSLRLVASQFRVNLGVASDIDLSPNLVLTPSIAAYGGRTFINFELQQNIVGLPLPTYNLHAHTHWWDIGGKIGAKLTYKVTPWLGVHVGGDASLAHRHAQVDASDAVSFVGTTSSIDVSRNRLAFMAAGHVGVSALYGNFLVLTVQGTAEYDHRQPRFVPPSTGGAVAAAASPATLGFKSVVNYRVMAEIKIKLW